MVLESKSLKNWEGMSSGHRVSFGLGSGKVGRQTQKIAMQVCIDGVAGEGSGRPFLMDSVFPWKSGIQCHPRRVWRLMGEEKRWFNGPGEWTKGQSTLTERDWPAAFSSCAVNGSTCKATSVSMVMSFLRQCLVCANMEDRRGWVKQGCDLP